MVLMPLLVFCCMQSVSDSQYFLMGQTIPQNCPFPWGISTPIFTWFLVLTRVAVTPCAHSNRHFDLFSRFRMTRERDQQTHL